MPNPLRTLFLATGRLTTTYCPANVADNYRSALGVGIDIETGGHVFQLYFTNAKGMSEKFFVLQTTGNFFDGDSYSGFTIARNFTVKS